MASSAPVLPVPDGPDDVVSHPFQWRDLYRAEDWWTIWLGFLLIVLAIAATVTGTFTLAAVKVATWGDGKSTLADSVVNLGFLRQWCCGSPSWRTEPG